MRTWWVYKATDTHSEYVIFTPFPLQQWLRENALFLKLRIACVVTFKSRSIRNFLAIRLVVSQQLSTRFIWLRLRNNYRLLLTQR